MYELCCCHVTIFLLVFVHIILLSVFIYITLPPVFVRVVLLSCHYIPPCLCAHYIALCVYLHDSALCLCTRSCATLSLCPLHCVHVFAYIILQQFLCAHGITFMSLHTLFCSTFFVQTLQQTCLRMHPVASSFLPTLCCCPASVHKIMPHTPLSSYTAHFHPSLSTLVCSTLSAQPVHPSPVIQYGCPSGDHTVLLLRP